MRSSRMRLHAGALRVVSRRAPGCVQLQTSGVLPELRGAAHGRERSLAGRRGVARAASAPVGAEFPVPTAFPVCQLARDHGPGAGHRLPRDRDAPGQASGIHKKDSQDRRGHPDPVLRQCTQPKKPGSEKTGVSKKPGSGLAMPHSRKNRGLVLQCHIRISDGYDGYGYNHLGYGDSLLNTLNLQDDSASLLSGLRTKVYGLNISSQATHNKTPILNESTERFGTAGSANICLKHWKRFRRMQRTGFGFTITNGHTKPTVVDHH